MLRKGMKILSEKSYRKILKPLFLNNSRGENLEISGRINMNQIFGMQEEPEYPYDWQIKMLGLDEKRLNQLKGGNILDIGCGREANLVYHLRRRGVNAEGIDSRAPSGDGFLRQHITNVYPGEGSIMRGNEEYDAVFANSMDALTHAFSDQEEASRKVISMNGVVGLLRFEAQLKKTKNYAPAVILEILRVLKPGGYFISSPDLNKLEDRMGKELRGCRIEREPVGFVLELEKMIQDDPDAQKIFTSFGYDLQGGVLPDFLKNRLVIYKS
jgi:SAM-dependent methyltransferase